MLSPMVATKSRTSALWGITTHFNPGRYQTRLKNYRAFRERSRAQGLPLVTVELSTEESGPELVEANDADILVQRTSSTVLWHKERMLNIAIESLPPECEYVCWIDADVLFEDDDWIQKSIVELKKHKVIQPFENVIRPSKDAASPRFPRSRIGWLIRKSWPSSTYTSSFCSRHRPDRTRITGTTGYAWCARRDLLDKHGFYDRCIVGGGDRELALAFVLPTDAVPAGELRIQHTKLRDHIARWHDRMYSDVRGDVSYVRGAIHHLWHGEAKNRGYTDRHQILERHDFDPERDIALDSNGCWSWTDGNQTLADEVKKYFASRKEDG